MSKTYCLTIKSDLEYLELRWHSIKLSDKDQAEFRNWYDFRPSLIENRVEWFDDNISMRWCFEIYANNGYLYFEKEDDLILYKLVWL